MGNKCCIIPKIIDENNQEQPVSYAGYGTYSRRDFAYEGYFYKQRFSKGKIYYQDKLLFNGEITQMDMFRVVLRKGTYYKDNLIFIGQFYDDIFSGEVYRDDYLWINGTITIQHMYFHSRYAINDNCHRVWQCSIPDNYLEYCIEYITIDDKHYRLLWKNNNLVDKKEITFIPSYHAEEGS